MQRPNFNSMNHHHIPPPTHISYCICTFRMNLQIARTLRRNKWDMNGTYGCSIDSNVLFYISADAAHTKVIFGVTIGVLACLCVLLTTIIVCLKRKSKFAAYYIRIFICQMCLLFITISVFISCKDTIFGYNA